MHGLTTPFAARILPDSDTSERADPFALNAVRLWDATATGCLAYAGRPPERDDGHRWAAVGHLPSWTAIHYASVNPLTSFP